MTKFLSITLLLSIALCAEAQTLTGKITDAVSGEALIGATIYIPDLETGGTTNLEGLYSISNLPRRKFLVQVKSIGYTAITEFIDFSVIQQKDFRLTPSLTEIQEVVITGSAFLSDPKRTSVSLAQMDAHALRTIPSSNIVSALATIPGVSEISTGTGISKPVIRGLSYNRIIILSEGVRQEGQQWGDEHGLEIDQFNVDRIEILKGPGSLLYGSDAMGGVINILEPHSAVQGTIGGELSSNYSFNNRLTANSLMLEGNQKGITWRARGTYKSAAAFRTPEEHIYNSAFNEKNYNGMLGVNKSWGFSHLHFSRYNANFGLIEGERDSASNKFMDAEGLVVTEKNLKSRTISLPFQNVQHHKISSVNNIILGECQLKMNLGLQNNTRKEFEESSTEPGLIFNLNTITYDLKFHLPVRKEIESVIGFSGMTQSNENLGEEFLVPDYKLQDLGAFVYAKKSFEKLTFNAGARFDQRANIGERLIIDTLGLPSENGDTLFPGFTSTFSAFSGATGLTYQITNALNLKFNIGKGWRAPNIAELGSNGVHEGTFRYEIGNPALKAETSMQAEGEISAEWKYLSASFNPFYNGINNYIYIRNVAGVIAIEHEDTIPVYEYVQGNSVLKGFEAYLDIHPLEQVHFESSISYVEGINKETKTPLPFIPATRIKQEVKWELKTNIKRLRSPYIELGISHYMRQERIDVFETPTPAYTLLNATIGADIQLKKTLMTIFISGENLGNVKYYNHLSRLKYIGIYNMGRNITVGLNATF